MIYWKIIFQMISKPHTLFTVLVRKTEDQLKGSSEKWPIDTFKMNRLILLSEYNYVIWQAYGNGT